MQLEDSEEEGWWGVEVEELRVERGEVWRKDPKAFGMIVLYYNKTAYSLDDCFMTSFGLTVRTQFLGIEPLIDRTCQYENSNDWLRANSDCQQSLQISNDL
jgi:myo-inositol catabolism protein IolC